MRKWPVVTLTFEHCPGFVPCEPTAEKRFLYWADTIGWHSQLLTHLLTTSLHSLLETAPYMNDAVLSYAYFNYFMQLNPTPEDIAAYNTEFDGKSFANSVQLTSSSVFAWKDH